MAKKPGVKNSSMDDGLLSKNRTWVDFCDEQSLSINPERDSWRARLCATMLFWAENPESLEVGQFCMAYKIPRTTLWQYCQRYPDIKKSYDNMCLMIATHRKLGSMNKKLDGSYAYRDMHIYDSSWDAVNKYHADLKKEDDNQGKTYIVYAEKPKIVSKEELLEREEVQ